MLNPLAFIPIESMIETGFSCSCGRVNGMGAGGGCKCGSASGGGAQPKVG